MWRHAVVALLTTACGRLSFDSTKSDGGTATGDGAPPCVFGPWANEARIDELNTIADEADPAIRFDGLEIVFARDDATNKAELWIARRTSTTSPFGAPHPLSALNTITYDNGPAYSSDGLTLYYKCEVGGITLWTATRSALDQDFTNPTRLAGGPFDEMSDPSISADGLELFNDDSFGNLYDGVRASTAEDFVTPAPVPAPVATSNWHEGPSISRDNTTLYYVEELGSLFEIRVATRPGRGKPFGTPASLAELAGGTPKFDPELSADGLTLYFVRYEGGGESNIFKLERSCL